MKNVRIKYTMERLGIYESLLEDAITAPHISEDQRLVLQEMQREVQAVKERREEEAKAQSWDPDVRVRAFRIEFTPGELTVYAGLLSEAEPLNEMEDQLLPLMREDLENAKARAEGRRHPLKPKNERKPRVQRKTAQQITLRLSPEKFRLCRQLFYEKGAQLEADLLARRAEERDVREQQDLISSVLAQFDATLRKMGGQE